MKKFIAFLIIIGLSVTGYFYRTEIQQYIRKVIDKEEKISRVEEKILREFPLKEVEIFRLGIDKPQIVFTKSGTVNTSISAYIAPQISGKITEVKVKIGDQVAKGEILITLGDSISTDMLDLQYQTALDSVNLAYSSLNLTKDASINTLRTAQISTTMAEKAFQNAISTKRNTQSIFEEQLNSAELAIQSAEDAYKNAKNSYNNATDILDELEEQYEDLEDILEPSDPKLKELKLTITQTEAQVDAAKFAKTSADTAIEQTELGLEQLEKNIASQSDQLDFAIQAAYLQYRNALIQSGNAKTGVELQELGIEGQILQANATLKAAGINLEQKDISSPIDGIVTSVSAEEENLTVPGQILVKVENLDKLSVKTSVNEKEVKFLSIGDSVMLEGEFGRTKGKIASISPVLNEISKKIDIEIEISEAAASLTSGSFVKVTFSPQPKKIIFIPLNSIFLEENKKTVKVVDKNDKVQSREIQTGQIIGEYIEVLSGLQGNEKIIKTVNLFLEEGEKVALK